MASQLVRDLFPKRRDIHIPEHAELQLTRILVTSIDIHDDLNVFRPWRRQDRSEDSDERRVLQRDFGGDAGDCVHCQLEIGHRSFLLPYLYLIFSRETTRREFTLTLHA